MITLRWPITAAAILSFASISLTGAVVPTHVDSAAYAAAQGNDGTTGQAPERTKAAPDCTGVKPDKPDPQYLCDDWRLGPKELPVTGQLSQILKGYDRLGGEPTSAAFLAKWWDSQTGRWKYPPENGFVTDPDTGKPKFVTRNLSANLIVSRFGSENGNFLTLANTPYTKRALPPSNLDTSSAGCPNDFHLYKVVKPIAGEEGFMAPGFGQLGGGAQYFSKSGGLILRVQDFVAQGYLQRLNCSLRRS